MASVWFSSLIATLLCLHRLVKAVGPAATLHRAAGELVDDLHGAVAVDEIVPVPLVQLLGPDRGLELMDQVVRHLVVEVVDAECPLDRSHTLFERATVRFSSSTS